jgi:hypothetical protein
LPSSTSASASLQYLEYCAGCGQSYPDDPMIGVLLDGGAEKELWRGELATAAPTPEQAHLDAVLRAMPGTPAELAAATSLPVEEVAAALVALVAQSRAAWAGERWETTRGAERQQCGRDGRRPRR